MKNILKKQYLKIEFTLLSPLSIGNGKNEKTDQDIVLNSRGIPYIPGSAVAGVFRDACEKVMGDEWTQRYFGNIRDNGNKAITESQFRVYDAYIQSEEYFVSRRDGVALDDYKYGIPGAKFDREILESGIIFRTFIERDIDTNESEEDAFNKLAEVLHNIPIFFGSKISRGYGRVGNFKIFKKEFSFNTNQGSSWLDFDMYKDNCWKKSLEISKSDKVFLENTKITLELALQGGISIRQYTTEIKEGVEQVPDMKQLIIRQKNETGNIEEVPVIPGTTWAGAIGHRMKLFYPNVSKYFGKGGEDGKMRSKIFFSESQIKDAVCKVISRNAIDRFTGSTVDGALFTEQIYYGGTTVLEIYFDLYKEIDLDFVKSLAVALSDLHEGILAIGGGTSIGRGIFKVTKVNDSVFSGDGSELYKNILDYCKMEE
ncbi:MAG: CRISPR-associated protein [Lachnospiraceae bacterium]|nr:MAG: CRISPR-associated protein [Lachnospiraceae bacterium]